MLRLMLNSHSQIRCHGEVFPPIGHPASNQLRGYADDVQDEAIREHLVALRRDAPLRFLDEYVLAAGKHAAVGVKIKYSELENSTLREIAQRIKEDKNIRIVHLVRENRLRRLISHKTALQTGVNLTLSGDSKPALPKISLTLDECLRDFEDIATQERKYRQFFSGHPIFEVTYEQIVGSQPAQVAEVQKFLGVDPEPLSSPTIKLRTNRLDEAIENYAELQKAVRGTPYEGYFE